MMLPGTRQGTSVRPNPGADYPFDEYFGGKLRRYRTGEDSGSNCPTYRVDDRVTEKRLEAE